MQKLKLVFILPLFFCFKSQSQSSKVAYAEIGGPGLASVNFDMRFSQKEDGFGGRVGVGRLLFSHSSTFTIPVGVNYLLGKDGKNYFELGVGYTYSREAAWDDFSSKNFSSSFGNLTIDYRLAPTKGGFIFKAEITPVFGKGFFIPYYGGIGFGYKF